MEAIQEIYRALLWFSVMFIAVAILAVLVRSVKGPRFTDRIVAIDVICSLSAIMIILFSYLFDDTSLLDVALVYAMVGFLSVVILSRSYQLPYHDRISDTGHSPTLIHLTDEDEEDLYG
jgi:multicomponent Na+:H+ antiporter subunit F